MIQWGADNKAEAEENTGISRGNMGRTGVNAIVFNALQADNQSEKNVGNNIKHTNN